MAGAPGNSRERLTVDVYGSARIAAGFEGDEPRLRDNLSRAGLYAAKDSSSGYGLFARLEVGVNLVNTFDRILNPFRWSIDI